MNKRADIFGGAGQRLEVDMRRDVGLSRSVQGIGEAVTGDRLEGVAGVAAYVTIVDDQRRAVLVAHARCDLHHFGIGPPFEHRADRRGTHQRRQQHLETRDRVGRRAEHQLAVGVEVDHALVPTVFALHDLMDRQHVEIFIGEDDAGTIRHLVDIVMPGDVAHARQGRLLLLAQHRIDLDQMHAQRLIERRQHAHRAQRVRHHRAAAGPELDQPEQRRRAHRPPERGRPQPEQFAEHLADFGGGGEVAFAPERVARNIVAVLGMHQAQFHVTPYRHRAG